MRDEDEGIARLLEIALQIEGLYRHASTHAAGVVIGDRPLIELVPLYRDPRSDFLVTQYSMKHVEQAGLVKFDFLGLTTLTILQRAEAIADADLASTVDLDRLPLDDAKTYEMLAARRCRRGVPDGRPGHARHAAPDAARPVRGPDRRGRAVSARPDGATSPTTAGASTARNGRRRIPSCTTSWPRPTASWSTRNR